MAVPLYACPFCADNVNAANKHLAWGYYWSVLFMLAVVFTVVGVIGAIIVRAQRASLPAGGRADQEGSSPR